MHEILLLCLALVLSVSFLVLLAQKLKIAYPIFLVAAGLALGFIPGIPNTQISIAFGVIFRCLYQVYQPVYYHSTK